MDRQRGAKVAPVFVVLVAAAGMLVSAQGGPPVVPQGVRAAAASQGRVSVLVELRLDSGPFRAEGRIGRAPDVLAQRRGIERARERVLARLTEADGRERRRFATVPFVALELTPGGLAALEGSPDVLRIVEDAIARPTLVDSVPRIEGDQLWQLGYDGAGAAVAVLDSGVEADHPFFGGRVSAEACFSSTVPGLSQSLCPNGEATQIGAGAGAPCARDECAHGTHVAGIAAGNGDPMGEPIWGVARGAGIMGIQVFSDIVDAPTCGGTAPCLGAFSSDIIAALEHVYDTAVAGTLHVAAVNMSLGGGSFTAPCDDEPFKPAIDNLRAVGVASVVASGNSFDTVGMSSPGCVSSAVSVGSTDANDQVSLFSNVAPFLSLLAPGEAIISSVPGGGFDAFSGTSMATPHVAGAWAAMRQAVPEATVDELLAALQATGLPVTDTRYWAPGTTTVPRVRLFRALASLTPLPSPEPQLASVSPPTVRAGPPATLTLTGSGFNGLSVAHWNGTAVPTTAVSITELRAVVPASLISVGTALVSVVNPAPGGGTSAALPVTVLPPPVLTVSASSVGPGASVTVTLQNGYGGAQDWLALAAAGGPDTSYIQSTFVGAGVLDRTWTVTMPQTPGPYEFRLFLDNGFVRAATSPVVTVDAAISPAPVASSLSPSQALAGSPGFTLTVGGSQFVASSVVRWNGSSRPTTFVNSTQLRATIAAADVATAGAMDVTVFTPSPGGGTSSPLTFTVTAAPSLAVSSTSVAAGSPVTVTLTNGLGGGTDWLAFAAVGAPDNGYLQFTYVGAGVTTRDWTVTAPSATGQYEFRLYRQGSFVRAATSAPVAVQGAPPPALSVSATAADSGDQVTVTLTNGLGGSTDWLSFAAVGAADNAYLQFAYVGAGVTTRDWTVTMPAAAGQYEFRLYKQGSFVRLATSEAVTVASAPPPEPAPDPELTVSHTSVAAGAQVTVTLANGLGGSTDWLSFAATGAADNGYLQFTYVGAGVTTRTWTVTAPSAPGTYEFRLYRQGSFTRLATSPAVTVQAPADPVLTVDRTSVVGGQTVTVTLAGGLGGSQDWLSFAATGAANNGYLQFTYVGAGVTTRTWTVTTPTTPGTYEFRLFRQGTFTRLATSEAITVQAPAPPTLTVSTTTAAPGEQVTVTLTNGLGGGTDWLSFARVGAADNGYLQFTYVGAGVTTRTWTVTMPSTPGTYEFRLYRQASFVRIATSPPVTGGGPEG